MVTFRWCYAAGELSREGALAPRATDVQLLNETFMNVRMDTSPEGEVVALFRQSMLIPPTS
jgi:hypothetical protein